MNNPLCKYKDILGKPRSTEGLRKYRFFGIAILDTVVVILSALAFAYFFQLPYVYTIAAFFLLGIVVHRLFCVRTAVDVMLFGK
jgi:hypothetical protein